MARTGRITTLALTALGALLGASTDADAARQRGGRAGGPQPRSGARSARPRATAKPATPNVGSPGSLTRGGTDRTRLGATADADEPLFGFPAARERQLYFATADADSSGWISFREAKSAIRFDAPRFRAFDTDNDGRFTMEEYSAFVVFETSAGRAIEKPTFIGATEMPPARNAEQLRAAYDVDLDGKINRLELERMVSDYERGNLELEAAALMPRLDANGDSSLDRSELERLAGFLTPLVVDSVIAQPKAPGARTIMELFGQPIDAGENNPPRIIGPVRPFRRLDVNNDGFVDLEDLERLKGRTFARVRLGSVLNTLDIDYDGRLSEREFLSAMTPKAVLRKPVEDNR